MKRICLITFGCQMNKLDSELAREALLDAGHIFVESDKEADVVIFNTCSVRDHAEQRVVSRLYALKARKQKNPDFILGIMGCFAERDGDNLLKEMPFLDFVIGTRQFMRLPELIGKTEIHQTSLRGDTNAPGRGILEAHDRTRHQGAQAYVSIMRGCNNFCSYCIVPHVRGREISRPLMEVVKEAEALVRHGAREITLLGQNIDAYGKDINSSLAELLKLLDKSIPEKDGLRRIRFVTSHPRDITEELVKTVNELPRVAKHFHMPAQSGSDKILKKMNRGYSRIEYEQKMSLISTYVPEALVASDFIVGFPDEDDNDFKQTLDLVKNSGFQNSYIFKYSARPGTLAADKYVDNIPDEMKKQRNHELLQAQEKVNKVRSNSLIDSLQTVMAEGESARDKLKWTGRTGNNLICVFSPPVGKVLSAGDIVSLRIVRATPLTLFGEIE